MLYYGIAVAEYGLGNYKSVVDYCDKALEITYFDALAISTYSFNETLTGMMIKR